MKDAPSLPDDLELRWKSGPLKQFQSYCVAEAGGAGIYACGIAVKKEIGFSH